MGEVLPQWPFVWAAFAVVGVNTAGLIAQSWWAMARAEKRRDTAREQ